MTQKIEITFAKNGPYETNFRSIITSFVLVFHLGGTRQNKYYLIGFTKNNNIPLRRPKTAMMML